MKLNFTKRRKEKNLKEKQSNKMKACYTYEKINHFARDCCYDSRNSNDEIIIVMKSCSIKFRVSIIIIDLTSEANNIAHELDKRALLVDSFNEQISKTRRLDK